MESIRVFGLLNHSLKYIMSKINYMKLPLVVFLVVFVILSCTTVVCKKSYKKRLMLISNEMIYGSVRHAAFTGLLNYKDTFFVVFREGEVHDPKNVSQYGRIAVIKRINNQNVDTTYIGTDTADYRDPCLLLVRGKPRLYCFYTQRKTKGEGPNYGGTIFSDYDNGKWSEFKNVRIPLKEKYVLWKVRKIDNDFYSVGYNMKKGPILFKSKDGIDWQFVKKLSDNGNFTEGDLYQDTSKDIVCILRNENSIGSPSVVFSKNTNSQRLISKSIASPNIYKIDHNNILCAGREYDFVNHRIRPDSINVTVLLLDEALRVKDRLVIPGSRLGDKAYPGIVVKKDTIYMSYYFGSYNRSDIYMAKIVIL